MNNKKKTCKMAAPKLERTAGLVQALEADIKQALKEQEKKENIQ